MGKLEEQLRRAERKHAPAREKPKGGPVEGVSGDRWIAWHATMSSRNLAYLLTALCLVLLGLPALMFAYEGDWGWAKLMAVAMVSPIVVAWTIHLLLHRGAAENQRRYLATLPFEIEGYAETMSEPRWWAKVSYAVVYKPELRVAWVEYPGDAMVEKLATLAGARFDNGVFAPTSSSVVDPWRWTRKVVSEVLIPLREKTDVASAKLTVKRDVEYTSSGD